MKENLRGDSPDMAYIGRPGCKQYEWMNEWMNECRQRDLAQPSNLRMPHTKFGPDWSKSVDFCSQTDTQNEKYILD